MRCQWCLTPIILAILFSSLGAIHAQTITVSPASPQVALGGTVQFSATVTGVSPTAVTWSAGSVKGGNSTAGTISATGLYKAPAVMPAQDPVQITATSTAITSKSASVYVNLLTHGPTVTSVSPNPIAVGNLTVKIEGSGFKAGATVYDTYGSNSRVQLSTTSVTSTVVTATGYQGSAPTATFCVKNAGSDYSNSITVPIGTLHKLTVVNGTGSGSYTAGKVVTITANTPPTGETFSGWTGATVASPTSSTTTITMPSADTTVTANYAAPKHTLTVVNGSGSGSYAAGTVVTITANSPSGGQTFSGWSGATVASATSPTTTITIPSANTTVTANFGTPTKYTLTVASGSGGGSFTAGTVVTITANAPATGMSFSDWTGASVASATSSTTTLTMPASNTTVTANYIMTGAQTYSLTVINGTGSGNYAAGTLVPITANTAPAGQAFLDWTQTTTTFPSKPTTTAVMPAYSTTVQANYLPITNATVPYPVAVHPRLWVTPSDVTRLQSWATSTNPIWTKGMQPLLAQAVSVYNTYYFPGGQVANPFPDPGDVQGYGILNAGQGSNALTSSTEQWAFLLAFGSLIDPSTANRITDAQDARNLLMVAINQAALGNSPGDPFRDPLFATYNRGSASVSQYPLIVDWIYNATDGSGNPILTASDKATIRNVFMNWSNDCLNAYTDYNDRPSPEGVTNSLTILPGSQPYRMASNNYYLAHARLMTMLALSMDPSDDPPVNPGLPAAQLGNTLRSYILDANGAWLYQEYAMMGDPSAVTGAYGIGGSGAGFGLASGGLPPEGMLYGESFAYVLEQLLALQTAGFNNPSNSGPQINLISSPVWNRFVTGYMSSLTPVEKTYALDPSDGSVFQFASFGDVLREWVAPYNMEPFALLTILNHENGGGTTNDNADRWFAENATPGGPAGVLQNITDPFSWDVVMAPLYYMLLDPAAPAATDPRAAFPTYFYDPAAGRVIAHSDWTPNGDMFDYRASWESINHQDGDGGQFEFFRKGEWLTKEMSNYDNNAVGMTTYFHNGLALKNWCANGTPANLQFYETGEWANGSEWILGQNAGDPTTVSSTGPGYVYAASNLTKLFNRPVQYSPNDAATDITQATRSVVWLNNDYIVVYDRATSVHPGLFKKFNLSMITSPAISGNTATETMADGQKLFVQTLLPLNAAITSTEADTELSPIADLEPTKYIMTVQDPTLPTDTRFLHVLQGADGGGAKATATYAQSTSGTAFDGAVFGASAVFFPVSSTASFTGTVLTVPGVTTLLVTGLTPNASYGVSVTGSVVTITTTGTTAKADTAGVLSIGL